MPFPVDWRPDAKGIATATAHGIVDIERELQRCVDWHLANAKDTADPAASWRTWCGKYRPPGAAHHNGAHASGAPRSPAGMMGVLRRQAEKGEFDG